MAKRVTIMVDKDLDEKLRNLQSKQIRETGHGYSYSMAVNTILAKVVK